MKESVKHLLEETSQLNNDIYIIEPGWTVAKNEEFFGIRVQEYPGSNVVVCIDIELKTGDIAEAFVHDHKENKRTPMAGNVAENYIKGTSLKIATMHKEGKDFVVVRQCLQQAQNNQYVEEVKYRLKEYCNKMDVLLQFIQRENGVDRDKAIDIAVAIVRDSDVVERYRLMEKAELDLESNLDYYDRQNIPQINKLILNLSQIVLINLFLAFGPMKEDSDPVGILEEFYKGALVH